MYSRKTVKKTTDPLDTAKAYGYAIRLLGARGYTEKALLLKLIEKGFTEGVARSTVLELKQLKYIGDQGLAEQFVESAKRYKSYGYMMIKKKMMERKFSMKLIDETLDTHFDEDVEMRIAQAFIEKFLGSTVTLRSLTYEEKQKLRGKLAARGFRSQVIQSIL